MTLKESDIEKIRLVAAILEKDYKHHYRHRQLASKAGTNESKLRVGFKQVYNSTIHEYLTTFRVKKVKEMLLTTNWSLQVIARHCGFKNSSILIRNFKKHTTQTPLEWKAQSDNVLNDLQP
jgi:AraC-like DNA-binding protein